MSQPVNLRTKTHFSVVFTVGDKVHKAAEDLGSVCIMALLLEKLLVRWGDEGSFSMQMPTSWLWLASPSP